MTCLIGTDMGTKSVPFDAEEIIGEATEEGAEVTGLALDYIPDAKGAPQGDAILAGLGTGVITDHRVIEDWLMEKVKTEPNPEQAGLYDAYHDLH